jgi:predicted N-acyltransferase
MIQVLFLIPLVDESGEPLQADLTDWEVYMAEMFGSVVSMPTSVTHAFAALLAEATLDAVAVFLVVAQDNEGQRIAVALRMTRAVFGRAWVVAQYEPDFRH